MLTIPPDGQTPDKATILGQPNDEPPIQVHATGMFKSIRKGETRWVTGTDVAKGLSNGVIVQIGALAPVDYAEPTVDVTIVHTPAPLPEPTEVDRALVDMSKSELVKVAQAVGLDGRSAMDKSELYEHLRHHPVVPDHLR